MNRRENVELSFDSEGFTGRMKRIAEAARAINRDLELRRATWEPHDWSDFD